MEGFDRVRRERGPVRDFASPELLGQVLDSTAHVATAAGDQIQGGTADWCGMCVLDQSYAQIEHDPRAHQPHIPAARLQALTHLIGGVRRQVGQRLGATLDLVQTIQKQMLRRDERSGASVMATLAHDLEALIEAYVREERSLADLREWLLDHVQDVLDSPDPRLAELDGVLWRLISEYDRRDRDEASVRTELTSFLTPVRRSPAAPSRSHRATRH